mmetsp:Transcript_17336/g.37654  ORF Transcript_17336/g.37654 Transcript_17336/m.37654 type:complete len:98 (-) Transcript_17336:1076-1369(-)
MKAASIVAVALLCAAFAHVRAQTGTCRCTIQETRTCEVPLLTQPNECILQTIPCEPCFCDDAGADFCDTEVITAYVFPVPDLPFCEPQEIAVARCPN